MITATYSTSAHSLVDSYLQALSTYSTPKINYKDNVTLRLTVVNSAGTAVNLSEYASFSFAIDIDFSLDTEPMCRTIDASIIKTSSASGTLTIPICCDTSTFLAATDGKSAWQTVKAELQCFYSNGDKGETFQFDIMARGLVDALGGTPPDPVGNYYTKAETLSVISHDVIGAAVGAVSGLKVVAAVSGGYSVADPTNVAHAGMVVGVALTAAASGGTIHITSFGTMTDASWAWSLYTPVYLGLNGTLTQTCPTSGVVFTQQIGFPLNATTLMIRPSVYILA